MAPASASIVLYNIIKAFCNGIMAVYGIQHFGVGGVGKGRGRRYGMKRGDGSCRRRPSPEQLLAAKAQRKCPAWA